MSTLVSVPPAATSIEDGNRWRKVAMMLATALKHQMPAEAVEKLTPDELYLLAGVGGVSSPSDKTVKLFRDAFAAVPLDIDDERELTDGD